MARVHTYLPSHPDLSLYRKRMEWQRRNPTNIFYRSYQTYLWAPFVAHSQTNTWAGGLDIQCLELRWGDNIAVNGTEDMRECNTERCDYSPGYTTAQNKLPHLIPQCWWQPDTFWSAKHVRPFTWNPSKSTSARNTWTHRSSFDFVLLYALIVLRRSDTITTLRYCRQITWDGAIVLIVAQMQ